VLILDEPVSALDPMGRKDILDMLASLRGEKTVFFSTHILSDVERICDHAAIINEGKLVLEGSIGDISKLGGSSRIILETDADHSVLEKLLQDTKWILEFSRDESVFIIKPEKDSDPGRDIPALLAGSGIGLIRYEQAEPTLEDIFVKVVNGNEA
jgi:ABC-2 type transport system ATP-binding protein